MNTTLKTAARLLALGAVLLTPGLASDPARAAIPQLTRQIAAAEPLGEGLSGASYTSGSLTLDLAAGRLYPLRAGDTGCSTPRGRSSCTTSARSSEIRSSSRSSRACCAASPSRASIPGRSSS